METMIEMLSTLCRDRFYGSVEIKFEAGKPVLLRKTETIRPVDENYRENRGTSNERID
jgi:hypothetical protein